MPSLDVMMSSSPNRAGPDDIEFWKGQVTLLENELNDFQQSSKELESELEKELEGQEKIQNDLRRKVEAKNYEVEEWKAKYKESKREAGDVQMQLQKEITKLRDQNRELNIKLREIEVSNDDYERQDRIVKSSLTDLESKYNMAIERDAMNESEIATLSQEREDMRIMVQRLKDELNETKVEAELATEKYIALRNGSMPRFQSPMSEAPTTPPTSNSPSRKRPQQPSTPTTFSSPTPPSPPISETSTGGSSRIPTPADLLMTPRPSTYNRSIPRKTPSTANMNGSMTRKSRSSTTGGNSGIPIPASRSLTQIRGLIGQMQRLEQRVQSARSRMPQTNQRTPPRRNSPSLIDSSYLPIGNVTLRSQKKRPSSNASSSVASMGVDERFGSISRSFAGQMAEAMNGQPSSRPSSRASTSSRLSFSTGGQSVSRPSSRASTAGGGQSQIPAPEFISPAAKPRSSIGGLNDDIFATPRRNTLTRAESGTIRAAGTSTPTTGGTAIPRRKSMQTVQGGGGSMSSSGLGTRRVSNGVATYTDSMAPPALPTHTLRRKGLNLNRVGEQSASDYSDAS